ncbi:IclR family transcriptional regulator [Nitratireductor aquimarinus]|uniref:IclR family transcriptional regulator n=1 Tax=Nitratireductor aquimarinus TaxID=889300 RepID=UPI001A8F41C6|nr:IclR family transcriptional regulator [Nitratireductor aquimarinus]MBN8245770.1 IclR family transcriptional regulator [Nitratireductor aquimarinus]MBY6134150.1 IclR family transcriptional regulator [Nitratireductor aquimarinus]MCA1305236.1 IclR family transcriptional regulator [Nitratireductor aquimarinus]
MTKDDNGRQRYIIDAADACLNVLRFVSDNPGHSLSEIHVALGFNKSRTLRLLATLEAHNLVMTDGNDRWSLGFLALLIGNAANNQLEVVRLIQPHLDALRDATGETAQFRLLSKLQTLCIARSETRHAVRVHTEIGRPRPLYVGSSKAALAFADEALLQEVIDHGLQEFTDRTLTSEQLREQLRAIRAQGYSSSRGEALVGALALGAPVFGLDGKVTGCLSVLGPEERLLPQEAEIAKRLMATAARVSQLFGYRATS